MKIKPSRRGHHEDQTNQEGTPWRSNQAGGDTMKIKHEAGGDTMKIKPSRRGHYED